jgi:cytochrome c oxidase assembly protein subunit 15
LSLRNLAVLSTAVVFMQLLLGALMRHTGAGLAIPDFPLALGRVVPPFESSGVAIHFAHRVGALLVAATVIVTAAQALRLHRQRTSLLYPALLMALGVLVQILLGALTVWTAKSVVPTTLHVLNGALILATSLTLALRSFQQLRFEAAPSASFLREGAMAS